MKSCVRERHSEGRKEKGKKRKRTLRSARDRERLTIKTGKGY